MLTIRQAKLSDVPFLYELYMKHLSQHPTKEPQDLAKWSELLGELITDPNYYLLVGELDGKVIASITLIIIKNLTQNLRPYSLIENVVTHADYRNLGFAQALMNHASNIAIEHNCYKIMLMTGSKREETLRFYQNCGFNMQDKTAFIKWISIGHDK